MAAGVVYTARTRSPLFIWCAVAGALLYPFFVEPLGDWFVAVWFPTNHPVVTTMFGRAVPWLAVFFYLGGIPVAAVAAYHIVKRGLPAKYLLGLIGVIAILEVPGEMVASHFDWMIYYGNHALIAGVPIYCLVQNAGMFAVVAWVLGWLMPHVHGWRWVLVPLAVAAVLPVYAVLGTFPSYIAIAAHAGPAVSWTAGIVSTALNAAIAIACIYSPTLRKYREAAAAQSPQAPTDRHARGPVVPTPDPGAARR
ncbi:hypothetical protein B8W67_08945 [Mycolicibacillus koreensis]|uniref:Uncharacterized protein n=1 Tax=Mycolicibacillus koreensis TaxID=1069220 RepID=A0AA91SRU1_9MYCO|nr:hypothetical protein B8W67_08945 [Mycolicibacillus koreensis]